MARVVAVHGIGQQFRGENTLHAEWLPSLRDGLRRAGSDLSDASDLVCAFYGDLFRPKGIKALQLPPHDAGDVSDSAERELLKLWWEEAARVDPSVSGPHAAVKLRTPATVQAALNALSRSRFFAGLAERVMIADLKQVRAYMNDDAVRAAVQERVAKEIAADTTVLLGHSLGSVVAYEAACAHPEWPVRVLVTLGSPLGIRNLIFDRLRPAPAAGAGLWPAGIEEWFNIADDGDVVALAKNFRPLFGDRLRDLSINNGATAHNVRPYLTAEETGSAVAAGLAR